MTVLLLLLVFLFYMWLRALDYEDEVTQGVAGGQESLL